MQTDANRNTAELQLLKAKITSCNSVPRESGGQW